MNRRQFLAAALASSVLLNAESPRVSLGRCTEYSSAVYDTLQTMFDQLGGLSGLVANKSVTIKVHLTGPPELKLEGAPVGSAQWVHWGVIGCTIALLGEAGARRIRFCESAGDTATPLAAFIARAGWDPSYFINAAPNVELVNTTKLKQHVEAGPTLSKKNVFGMLPLTIYGTNAGVGEPGLLTTGFRGEVMHVGQRAPSRSAPHEVQPESPRDAAYRLPRVITDLCGARPIHLAILDGIETRAGGEGPWTAGLSLVKPGVLIAGLNPVSTDAVATAVMGFDPMSPGGVHPFRNVDNTMEFGEAAGLGTRDLNDIEAAGARIEDVVFPFGPLGAPTAV